MADNSYLRYKWTSLWLGLGTVLGVAYVCRLAIDAHLSVGLMLLWSFAYLVIGALLGFIFSVPKLISDSPVTDGTASLSPSQSVRARYQENTNLTQISDWLAKVLIGASLVQMKEIPLFVYKVAGKMGAGARDVACTAISPECISAHLTICCAGIIVYFLTWGFICGYLVMKLVLTEQFVDSGN